MIKVIILAGGRGTRLGELSNLIPKPMIKIGGKPMLWHIMKIYSFYGFNEFIITLGFNGDVIKKYFSNFELLNNDVTINFKEKEIHYHEQDDICDWKITLVDTGINNQKGSRIKQVEKFCESDINMVTYGDSLSNVNINKLLDYHKSHGKLVTLTGVQPPSRFGEIKVSNNRVVKFEEKPQTTEGLINGGFMIFNKELFNYLNTDPSCDFEIGTLDKLADQKELMVYNYNGFHASMDTIRDREYLDKLWDTKSAEWKIW